MRIPSIHIRKDDLVKVIKKYGEITIDNLDTIFMECKRYAVDTRSIQVDTVKLQQKVEKHTSSTMGDTNLVSDLIYALRVQLKHIGVQKIKQSDPQWSNLKDLVVVLNGFCETYDIPKREGYIAYLEIGFQMMSKIKKVNYQYCAKWLTQKVDVIVETYIATEEIKKDKYPKATISIHNYYVQLVAERTGILENFRGDPQNYVHFIRAIELTIELHVPEDIFIQAQFDALNYCNGIPRPQDLYSDKAKPRLIKFLSENEYKIELHSKSSEKTNWDDFKK